MRLTTHLAICFASLSTVFAQNATQPTCLAFAYICPVPDSRAIAGCTGCCCNYGYVGVSGTCGCALNTATATPAPTSASSTPQCSANAYICPVPDDRAINGCTGCCCNYGYVGVNGTCGCQPKPANAPTATPLPTNTPTPTPTQPTCGAFAYLCPVPDSRAVTGCTGCCCNYGYVGVSGTCGCQPKPSNTPTATPLPTNTPTPTPKQPTCGAFAYQCAAGAERPVAGCSGCCCNFGYVTNAAGVCACRPSPTPTPTPTPNTVTFPGNACGSNSFFCNGVGNANQPVLTGAPRCAKCCCNWAYRQAAAGSCNCSK